MSIKKTFEQKLEELNKRRYQEGKGTVTKRAIALDVFQGNTTASDSSKVQRFSLMLSGKRREFKSDELRILRKILQCTIDELFPISEDMDIEVKCLD